MSVYLVKGKGWRFDFTHKGERHSGTWFKTKAKARRAETERRKEVEQNRLHPPTTEATDMGFLELVNRRLDYVKAYRSAKHYTDCRIMARRWVQHWGELPCSGISQDMIQWFVLKRSRVSSQTANKEIRYLRSAFNFGKKRKWITVNPTEGIEFLPIEKKVKYIPPEEDIEKVLAVADRDTRDYLITIRESLARMGEVNRLTWADVDLKARSITLYTRKKKGGNLTPRNVPMTERLFEVLSRRFRQRDLSKPWVFWHTYWNREGQKMVGPYKERTKIMKTLCKKRESATSAFIPCGTPAHPSWIKPMSPSEASSGSWAMRTGPPRKSTCTAWAKASAKPCGLSSFTGKSLTQILTRSRWKRGTRDC